MTPKQKKLGILYGLFAATVIAAIFTPPVPQDLSFHNFIDARTCLNIPNFGDVASNVGFLIVGVLALYRIVGSDGRTVFATSTDAIPYAVIFSAVALVAAGSAYYHWAPDNARLVWDRLPMTLAFMALFAAVISDRIHKRAGLVLLPVFLVAGIASVFYWHFTEAMGQGDLRPYAIVQFFPMVAIPLIVWLFRPGRFTDGRYIAATIGFYGIAKVLETFDAGVFNLLGQTVSGHSLKHLVAALAAYMLYRMMMAVREQKPGSVL